MPEFGKLIGQFLTAVVDGSDVDLTPDIQPLRGTVKFTLNVPRIIETNLSPNAVIYGNSPITGILDSNGYLCTPNPSAPTTSGTTGLYVLATDDPDFNPTGLQYQVDYALTSLDGRPIALPSHLIAVPRGTTIDLALVIPPAASVPLGISAAEAAAAAAALSAAEAAASALSFIVIPFGGTVPPGTPSNTLIIQKTA